MKTKLHFILLPVLIIISLLSCNPRAETAAPVACFQPSVFTAIIDEEITFNADCSLDAESFGWSFGDGATSTTMNPVHVYKKPGTYEVRLKVYNKNLSDETTITIEITDNNAPNACFTMSSTSVSPGETVNFTNCSEFAEEYSWDFGDNNTSTEENPAHSYNNEGEYTITLTAYAGSTNDVMTKTVIVTTTNQVDPRDYSSITQWDEHYYTDFNDDGGFYVGSADGGEYTCSLLDGKYKVEVPDTNYNWIFTNNITEMPAASENYDLEMVLTMEKDDFWAGSGIAWAKSDDPFNFFFYLIDIEGWYIIGDNNNGYWMEDWVQKGQPITNKITIRKYNNKYFFFINEQLVEEFDFVDYFGPGFGVQAGANTITLFDEYGIWTTTQTKKSSIIKPKSKVPVTTKSAGFAKPLKVTRSR